MTPQEFDRERDIISDLIELARVVHHALDDSEEFEGSDGRTHAIGAQDFDDVCEALDKLDALPDDKPGQALGPSGKAAWALAAAANEWRAMADAPTDGTEIELLVRHRTWWSAKKNGDDLSLWEGPCRGQWLEFNGGGWSWQGHMGTPIGWRPLAALEARDQQGGAR
jgi:hypothetical protein